jgi:hypothetical protein
MSKQPIPQFATEDEEREFWATHDATDFFDFSQAQLTLMPNLRPTKDDIWEEVQREFPDDAVMQEVHYVRLLHYHQLKGLTAQERIRFFARAEEMAYAPLQTAICY